MKFNQQSHDIDTDKHVQFSYCALSGRSLTLMRSQSIGIPNAERRKVSELSLLFTFFGHELLTIPSLHRPESHYRLARYLPSVQTAHEISRIQRVSASPFQVLQARA